MMAKFTQRFSKRPTAPTQLLIAGVLAILSFSSAAEKSFNLDGFKDIKFGMSPAEISALGFTCSDKNQRCTLAEDAQNDRTLLGLSTWIFADYTNEQGIDEISVKIDLPVHELMEQFSEILGPPTIYDYVSFQGFNIRNYFWVSSNGNAIKVTTNQDVMHRKKLFGKRISDRSAFADYLGKKKTQQLIEEANRKQVNKRDF